MIVCLLRGRQYTAQRGTATGCVQSQLAPRHTHRLQHAYKASARAGGLIFPNNLFRWTVSGSYCAFVSEGARTQKGGVQPQAVEKKRKHYAFRRQFNEKPSIIYIQAVQGASTLTGVPTDCNMHTEASARAWETAWAVTSRGCYRDRQDAYSHLFSTKIEMCRCMLCTEPACLQACPQSAPGRTPPQYCAELTLSISCQNHIMQSEHVLINYPQLLMLRFC